MRDRNGPLSSASGPRHPWQEIAAFGGRGAGNHRRCGEVFVMTCHEFRQAALPLTLRELSRSQGEQVWGHAGDCRPCGDWLQTQRTLASGLQALQSRTASLQAGPHVERALLEVFRQGPRKATEPVAALGSTPVALRLSRFFEVGAYAAVAAAIVVGLFLGAQIWHDGAQGSHAQSQSASPVIAVAEPQGARSGRKRFRRSLNLIGRHQRPSHCRAMRSRRTDLLP